MMVLGCFTLCGQCDKLGRVRCVNACHPNQGRHEGTHAFEKSERSQET